MSTNNEGAVVLTNGMSAASTVWNGRRPTITRVNEMLLEAMEEVKKNPAYVEQAETMGMVAGRIVDSIKVEVMAAGLLLRASGGN